MPLPRSAQMLCRRPLKPAPPNKHRRGHRVLGTVLAASGFWLAGICFPGSAPAGSAATACDEAIAAAEHRLQLPSGLLSAIGRVETGRADHAGVAHPWPYAINAEGIGAFFATKQAAVAAVRALQKRGVRSIDVGCVQVNLMYHPAAFASLDQAFDPVVNVSYGAGFLRRTLRRGRKLAGRRCRLSFAHSGAGRCLSGECPGDLGRQTAVSGARQSALAVRRVAATGGDLWRAAAAKFRVPGVCNRPATNARRCRWPRRGGSSRRGTALEG